MLLNVTFKTYPLNISNALLKAIDSSSSSIIVAASETNLASAASSTVFCFVLDTTNTNIFLRVSRHLMDLLTHLHLFESPSWRPPWPGSWPRPWCWAWSGMRTPTLRPTSAMTRPHPPLSPSHDHGTCCYKVIWFALLVCCSMLFSVTWTSYLLLLLME